VGRLGLRKMPEAQEQAERVVATHSRHGTSHNAHITSYTYMEILEFLRIALIQARRETWEEAAKALDALCTDPECTDKIERGYCSYKQAAAEFRRRDHDVQA